MARSPAHTLSLIETDGLFKLGPASKIDLMLSQDKQYVGFHLHCPSSLLTSGIPIEFFVDVESAMALMQSLEELQRQFGLSMPKIATATTRLQPPKA